MLSSRGQIFSDPQNVSVVSTYLSHGDLPFADGELVPLLGHFYDGPSRDTRQDAAGLQGRRHQFHSTAAKAIFFYLQLLKN